MGLGIENSHYLIKNRLFLQSEAADSNNPPLQTVEKPVIIKSVPLNISPTPPETLSLPTRN
ncbi:hypothetical protein EUBSIR_01405 [[Eubacterium] siraeum DSM 15702]|uniref:Uncharacterized protein n=1 Tax=[Eubacterium] siraeum DSM 15702 TaxID=428128 RepID=B0MNJ8_9FIRM|nr:hypothetical protein EUBSIR_01405 [[Eubacterium] siraeum DSM 15702]